MPRSRWCACPPAGLPCTLDPADEDRRRLRLTDLETFVWLVTMRSFRAVAQRLNITQPAISARSATLEREFEVDLFERNQRSVVLTSKGLQLLAHAQRIVNIAEELRALAKPDTMMGVVRIGVVETIRPHLAA